MGGKNLLISSIEFNPAILTVSSLNFFFTSHLVVSTITISFLLLYAMYLPRFGSNDGVTTKTNNVIILLSCVRQISFILTKDLRCLITLDHLESGQCFHQVPFIQIPYFHRTITGAWRQQTRATEIDPQNRPFMFDEFEIFRVFFICLHFNRHIFGASGNVLRKDQMTLTTQSIPRDSVTYFVIHFDACDGGGETKFSAITIAIRISVRLNSIHVGRCQNTIAMEHMIKYKFTDASCVWIIVIDAIPYANVTIVTGGNHETLAGKTMQRSFFVESEIKIQMRSTLTCHRRRNNNGHGHLCVHNANSFVWKTFFTRVQITIEIFCLLRISSRIGTKWRRNLMNRRTDKTQFGRKCFVRQNDNCHYGYLAPKSSSNSTLDSSRMTFDIVDVYETQLELTLTDRHQWHSFHFIHTHPTSAGDIKLFEFETFNFEQTLSKMSGKAI